MFRRWRNGHFGDFEGPRETVSYPADGGAAFVVVYHYSDGPEINFYPTLAIYFIIDRMSRVDLCFVLWWRCMDGADFARFMHFTITADGTLSMDECHLTALLRRLCEGEVRPNRSWSLSYRRSAEFVVPNFRSNGAFGQISAVECFHHLFQ